MTEPEQKNPALAASDSDESNARNLVMPGIAVHGVVLALIASFGVFVLLASRQMIAQSGGGLGPGTFPMSLAYGLLGLVAIAFVALLRSGRDTVVEVKRPVALVLSMALMVLFVPLVETVGYAWTIVPWTLAFALCARVRAPFLLVISVATVLFVAFVVFEVILGTPLP